MAVYSTGEEGNEPKTEAGTTKQAPGASSSATFTSTTQAPGSSGGNILGMLSAFGANLTYGAETEQYLDALKKALEVELPGVEFIKLIEPSGAIAITYNDYMVLLVFIAALSYKPQEPNPYSEFIRHAHRSLPDNLKTKKMRNALLVSRHDYGRVQQMTHYVKNLLSASTSGDVQALTAAAFAQAGRYTLDTSINNVIDYIDRNNPQAVQPRIDMGFILNARKPKPFSSVSRDGFNEFDEVPLLAVGAYVEPIRTPDQRTGTLKYQPMIHITSITATIPHPSLALFGIALAVERFVVQQGWKNVYGFAKGKPNIGALSPDPTDTSKRWFAENALMRDQYIVEHCLPPIIAVDVVEGAARLPSLIDFTDQPNGLVRIAKEFSRFFGLPEPSNVDTSQIATSSYDDIIGYYTDVATNQLRDTRDITFLDVYAKTGVVEAATERLLNYYQDPRVRVGIVGSMVAMTSMFWNYIVPIHPLFAASIAQQMVSSGIQIVQPGFNDNVAQLPQFNNGWSPTGGVVSSGFTNPYGGHNPGGLYG